MFAGSFAVMWAHSQIMWVELLSLFSFNLGRHIRCLRVEPIMFAGRNTYKIGGRTVPFALAVSFSSFQDLIVRSPWLFFEVPKTN